jgi:hypothetical protein
VAEATKAAHKGGPHISPGQIISEAAHADLGK